MRELDAVIQDIRANLTVGDPSRVQNLATELELTALALDLLPVPAFESLRSLLQDTSFLGVVGSWQVVRFLSNNWKLLSPDQEEELRGLLVNAFDAHGDWMGAFIIGEILGTHYADERALTDLSRLGVTSRMPARALVPHGLEVFASGTRDPVLHAGAIAELRLLAASDIDAVREEAREALARLGKRS